MYYYANLYFILEGELKKNFERDPNGEIVYIKTGFVGLNDQVENVYRDYDSE